MFDFLFPKEWSTLKKLIWLKAKALAHAVEKTIIGNPIHILDALAKPAQALSVNFEPVQDLNGYDSPWPAGGGKNLLDPAKCSVVGPGGAYGLTVTHDQETETWTISGTPTLQNATLSFNFCTYSDFSLSGKGYQVQAFPISGTPIKNCYGLRNEAENRIAIIIDTVANPTVNMTFKVSVAATAQTAWSPYSNICPISGYSEAKVYVSPTQDAQDATVYTIDLDGTRYGGALDVVSGLLTVTHGQIASYAGESLPGEWISDRDVYSAGGTPTTGAQVVYELATPQTIQLTPQQVELLLGENNIWSDGEMTLTYLADGNASDEEALNILLGGRYVNTRGEDEPTDREALNIILGENER